MNLKVVTGLDNGAAKQALLKLAAEKAACFPKDGLCLDGPVELLLEHAIRCEDKTIFDSVVNVFKEVDASLLEYVATTISQSIRDMDPTNERYPVLASIVSKRIEWLKSQIEVLDKPFTWEMSDAEFSDNAKVQAFLRCLHENDQERTQIQRISRRTELRSRLDAQQSKERFVRDASEFNKR
ncbi:hypothetical protein PF008_g18454 [Phytophthora fragariae]|nr:hypothetical protein PF008_g18454 [Phytophthora fragariae]